MTRKKLAVKTHHKLNFVALPWLSCQRFTLLKSLVFYTAMLLHFVPVLPVCLSITFDKIDLSAVLLQLSVANLQPPFWSWANVGTCAVDGRFEI